MQVVEYGGHILEKPEDAADAFRVLSMLSGRLHHVHTGVALIIPPHPDAEDASGGELGQVPAYLAGCEQLQGGRAFGWDCKQAAVELYVQIWLWKKHMGGAGQLVKLPSSKNNAAACVSYLHEQPNPYARNSSYGVTAGMVWKGFPSASGPNGSPPQCAAPFMPAALAEPAVRTFVCTTVVEFDELSPETLQAYIDSGAGIGSCSVGCSFMHLL